MSLQHLDSIIAFVVVVAGVNLLFTTLTLMIAAVPWSAHPSWEIKTLLPNLDSNLLPHAERINAAILRPLLISDPTFCRFQNGAVRRFHQASSAQRGVDANADQIIGR